MNALSIRRGRCDIHQHPTGTVTLLFSDIEGSTHLLQQLGERYTELLTLCRQVQRAAFQRYCGHEVDTQGDSFFIAFARATDAVSAAIEAQRALAAQPWPEGVAVRLRMGLHTGEPQTVAEGYAGIDVHRAARIMSAGHGGQVLLSRTTADLVEHDLPEGVSLRDLGAHALKDLQHPDHLFQLVIEGLPADFPPLKTLDRHPNNLPIQLTPFIGREREVAAIQRLLQRPQVRLLTLTGPGGSGKTRLGLQVAAELSDHYADGVYFVNLAPISDPGLVIPTIAQTLGVKEGGTRPILEGLQAFLQEKQILLLLDNFEQVVSAAPGLSNLLSHCPHLKLLVTSRAVLHLSAEHEFPVLPLAIPDPRHVSDLEQLSQYEAVALFISRAQAIKPDFQVSNANAPAVAEICVRLDGLPLAIELAAARVKHLLPQTLLSRLEHRLQVLTTGAQDAPRRQQTLRNTIEWSYNLLTANEQRLFRRLSVFVGGCTLEAIEAVCATPDDEPGGVLDGVASLNDKSLLLQSEQEGEEPRFVMLETIREYGLECLTANGEEKTVRQEHAAYFLRLAEEADPHLAGTVQTEPGQEEPLAANWSARLEHEHENLRATLNWLQAQGDTERLLRLTIALGDFWLFTLFFSEGRHWLELALSATEGMTTLARVRVLGELGMLLFNLGNLERADELLKESLALAQELGDTQAIMHELAYRLRQLGFVAEMRSDYAAARSLAEKSLALSRQLGLRRHTAWAILSLAQVAIYQGEYTLARELAEECLVIYRERGSSGDPFVFRLLGELAFFQGHLAQAYTLSAEEGFGFNLDEDLLNLSGRIVLQQSNVPKAQILAEESLLLSREHGYKFGMINALSLLGKVACTQGNHVTARTYYEQSLHMAREQGARLQIAGGLEGLAGVVAAQGELTWAARLWGVAEALREALGAPIPPVYLSDHERSVATVRTQLGEPAFATAWTEGRAMTPEEVLNTRGAVIVSPTQSVSPPPEQSPPTYPDGLTAREVEVLRLVAQGLSNAEIAEQLIISLLTVKAHMRSLYNKLGISSRSAATRYAIEHNLM